MAALMAVREGCAQRRAVDRRGCWRSQAAVEGNPCEHALWLALLGAAYACSAQQCGEMQSCSNANALTHHRGPLQLQLPTPCLARLWCEQHSCAQLGLQATLRMGLSPPGQAACTCKAASIRWLSKWQLLCREILLSSCRIPPVPLSVILDVMRFTVWPSLGLCCYPASGLLCWSLVGLVNALTVVRLYVLRGACAAQWTT